MTKRREAWRLCYVKAAKATTDVPNAVPELISQRRRWLNGSFCASVHSTFCFYRIWTSGHNVIRKLWLQIETICALVYISASSLVLERPKAGLSGAQTISSSSPSPGPPRPTFCARRFLSFSSWRF